MSTRGRNDRSNMPAQSFPVTLAGEMWWNDSAREIVREFMLFPNRLCFAVEAEACLYQGTLEHIGAGRYRGAFSFPNDGTGTAWCTLVQCDGEYRLEGQWKQKGINETFDWHAVLEAYEAR